MALRRAGAGSLKGLCRVHDEKTPSFNGRPSYGTFIASRRQARKGHDVWTPDQLRRFPRRDQERTALCDVADVRYHGDASLGGGRRQPRPTWEVKLLVDHRRDLVTERTRTQNRLDWHRHELDPALHVPSRAANGPESRR